MNIRDIDRRAALYACLVTSLLCACEHRNETPPNVTLAGSALQNGVGGANAVSIAPARPVPSPVAPVPQGPACLTDQEPQALLPIAPAVDGIAVAASAKQQLKYRYSMQKADAEAVTFSMPAPSVKTVQAQAAFLVESATISDPKARASLKTSMLGE